MFAAYFLVSVSAALPAEADLVNWQNFMPSSPLLNMSASSPKNILPGDDKLEAAAPIGSPATWVTSNDYPITSLLDMDEGTTAFTLSISAVGKVVKCLVTNSSGHAELDEATCRLITARARFKPAKNHKGERITGSYSNKIRWQIPNKTAPSNENIPIAKPMQLTHDFIVGIDGIPSKCSMTGADADKSLSPCDAKATFQPYYNEKGDKIPVRVIMSSEVKIIPVEEQPDKAE